MTLRSTPGVVMKIPTRYTASMPSVNRSLLRSSGILNMFAIAFISYLSTGSALRVCGLYWFLDQLGLAARLLDQRLRVLAEGVCAHGECLVERAVTENLHGIETPADQT